MSCTYVELRTVFLNGVYELTLRKIVVQFDRLNNARSVHHANNEVLGGGRNHKEPQGKGVNSYFRRNEEALTRCHWQVFLIQFMYLTGKPRIITLSPLNLCGSDITTSSQFSG